MPVDPIQLVRTDLEAFNRRDLATMLEVSAEDCEWVTAMEGVDSRIYRGHRGIRQALEYVSSEWETWSSDPEAFEVSGDRVLVIGRVRARGTVSQVPLDVPAAWVYELRDDEIARVTTFTDPAAARAAFARGPASRSASSAPTD